ncbi:MAG: class I SAM-dependent methyltransferase [Patescibacteria group bacterium]|nr:class I SAM-dependent methyltransferase [Patescibacteria group bacterium]
MEQDTNEQLHAVAAYYDSFAAPGKEGSVTEYEEMYSTPLCKAEDQAVVATLTKALSKLQQQFPGQKLLAADIGCGEGLGLELLQSALNQTPSLVPVQYIGEDISSAMVAQASAGFKGKPGVLFTVADMHHIPVLDSSIHLVMSIFGPFSYSLSPEELVKEIHRVLMPGGIAVIMPYTMRLKIGFLTGATTAQDTDFSHTSKAYSKTGLEKLFDAWFEQVSIEGMNFLGNMIEKMADLGLLGSGPEIYSQILALDNHLNTFLPPECARHMFVIVTKSQNE